uniref:ERCC4 domain-containing protein n=1 Tax=viral metagenome TaxID=1070528 RepID=A0A6C0IT56_9ZZZZ
MIIKIDTRETEIYKRCQVILSSNPKFKDIQLVSETLPLGDMIIHDETNAYDCLIVERKSLSDLGASIKDGRYEEQSYRLNGLEHHNHNIIYLIEGDLERFNTFKERIDKQTLYSAMISIQYFKGFSVMRTNGLDETAHMCCSMAYKIAGGLKAGKKPYYLNKQEKKEQEKKQEDKDMVESSENILEQIGSKEKDYCSVIKKVKKDNVTSENIGEIMLCQIPGVSSTSALAILAKFKTLPNLIQSIQTDPDCLANICTTDANGKSRKISKTAIATIVQYLHL